MLQALKKRKYRTTFNSILRTTNIMPSSMQCIQTQEWMRAYAHFNAKQNEWKILAAVKWPWYFSCNKIDDEPLKALRDFSSSIYWRVRHVHQLFDLNHFNYDQIIYFIFTFWWRQISILFSHFVFTSFYRIFLFHLFPLLISRRIWLESVSRSILEFKNDSLL